MPLPNLPLNKKFVLFCMLLFCFTFALFSPSILYDFVGLDDAEYVSQNPVIQSGLTWNAIKWSITSHERGAYWAPLLWLSYLFDTALLGIKAWGYHLTNVFFHACNALLLFWFLKTGTRSLPLAFACALLWAIHPLRVESVAWITERKDVLSGFFFLLCVNLYVFSRQKGGKTANWAAVTSLACAMLVKPGTLIVAPFAILLLDIWPVRRVTWTFRNGMALALEKWAYWVVALGFGLAAFALTHNSEIIRFDAPPLLNRLLLIPGNYWVYLRQSIWPFGLAVLYHTPKWNPDVALFFLAGLLVAVYAGWKTRKSYPEFLCGILWMLGLLVPSIGVFWVGTTEGLGDRFSYLPAIGLAILLCGAIRFLPKNTPHIRHILIVAMALLVLLLAMRTTHQLTFWKDNATLTYRTTQIAPDNIFGRSFYASQLSTEGKWSEMLDVLNPVSLIPHAVNPDIWISISMAYLHMGSPYMALGALENVPELDSGKSAILQRVLRGQALVDLGRPSEAIPYFEKALTHQADLEVIDYIYAALETDYRKEAIQLVAKIKNKPPLQLTKLEDLLPLFIEKWEKHEKARAAIYFKKLIARNPENMAMLNNLTWMFAVDAKQTVPPAETLEIARQAANLMPEPDPAVLDTLAAAQANAGLFEEAVQTAEEAMNIAYKNNEAFLAKDIAGRLQVYREGRAWREP